MSHTYRRTVSSAQTQLGLGNAPAAKRAGFARIPKTRPLLSTAFGAVYAWTTFALESLRNRGRNNEQRKHLPGARHEMNSWRAFFLKAVLGFATLAAPAIALAAYPTAWQPCGSREPSGGYLVCVHLKCWRCYH